jgi:hypothetical protein
MFLILYSFLNLFHPQFVFRSDIIQKQLPSIGFGFYGFDLLLIEAGEQQRRHLNLIVLVARVDARQTYLIGIQLFYDYV